MLTPASAIVLISNYSKKSYGGGIQTFVEHLFDQLSATHPNTYLIARYGKPVTSREEVIAGGKLAFISKAFFACRKIKPSVIHTHANWYCIVPALLYRATRRVKIIHTMHSLPEDNYWWHTKLFFRAILRHCDNVNFVSLFLRNYFAEVQGINCGKSSVIYPGADHVLHEPIPVQNEFRKRFGIAENAVVVLAHGLTAHPKKYAGALILMEAFSKLSSEFSNLILVISKQGRYLDSLRNKAAELGIGQSIVFTGDLDNPSLANREAQIYAHITLGEGGVSLAVLEAMTLGNPIVAAKRGGIPELLSDHGNALLVEPTVDEITIAIKTLIDNPDLRDALIAKAQEKVRDIYTWKSTAEQFMSLYNSA